MRWFALVIVLVAAGCAHDHEGHSHAKVEARPYVVELFDDVDVDAFIDEHYIEPKARLPLIHGFSADLRPATVDVLEQDERVERLTDDGPTNALAEHQH